MRVGNLGRNVAELSELPSVESVDRARRSLDLDELRRLLDAAQGSRLIVVDLCGRNGLRPAEARGLLWADVDLDSSELSVTGQLTRENVRGAPKTKKAARTIRIDDSTVTRLKAWRERQDEHRAEAGPAWTDSGLVVTTSRGTPVDRHSLARSMRLLCKRAEVDPAVTAYELRHSAISMQADAGRSSWELADWAGTSEQMINQIYRHRLRRVSVVLPVEA